MELYITLLALASTAAFAVMIAVLVYLYGAD